MADLKFPPSDTPRAPDAGSTHWITTAEAADRAEVSGTTIRRWIETGELRAIRVGPGPRARIRVDLNSLLALVVPA